jgi:phosphonate transport system substrate-binding protein
VSVIGDSWELGYVALTRVTEDIDGIEALAGRRIVVVDPVRRSCLPTLWLEHAVHRVAARQPAAFFAEVTHVQDPSPAILSVLFGKIDAAVVSRRAFETMAELNPQVRRELAVVAESPGLLPAVTCIPAYVAVDRRDDIIEGALRLHEYPKGRQILTLFGTSQVIPFRDEYLQAVAGLVAQDWKD